TVGTVTRGPRTSMSSIPRPERGGPEAGRRGEATRPIVPQALVRVNLAETDPGRVEGCILRPPVGKVRRPAAPPLPRARPARPPAPQPRPACPRPPAPPRRTPRREALLSSTAWILSTAYCCLYCYFFGYIRPDRPLGPDDVRPILGMPSWFFWGVIVPWGLCAL